MQAQVREMYMRVIESTMENARNEMLENPGDEEMLGNLKRLEDRWRERLLHIQDFSEDPLLVRASSGGAARVRSTRANRSSAAPAAPALPASRMAQPAAAAAPSRPLSRMGPPATAPATGSIAELITPQNAHPPMVQPGTAYGYPSRAYPQRPMPSYEPNALIARPPANGAKTEPKTEPAGVIPRVPQGDSSHQYANSHLPQGDAAGDVNRGAGGEPPSKRVRRQDDDEENYNCNSDLDSSSDDSDVCSAGSDPEVDNYILAQHDRVRKGPGKWKVQLKEGIAHINGRDYLFNKATCDLDW